MEKILFLSRSLGAGGAEKRMVTVARLLKKRGCEIKLISYSNNKFFSDQLEKENISVVWLLEGGFWKKLRTIRDIIKHEHFQTVISFLPTLNIINCIASIGLKHKVIIGESSASSQFEQFMGWKYVIRAHVEDWLAWAFADFIVSNSDNARDLRKKRSKFLSKKIGTIHNPVSVPTPKLDYICKKDGILHVVVAASVQPIKNPIAVIKAISELEVKYRTQLKLDWYGSVIDESLKEQVIREIETAHLEKTINFHDATNDIGVVMGQADIVALFSVAEGLPNAICEGMMLGKPIIMTRISDYKKMVDELNGFLCDSNDIISIKDAFVNAIDTPETNLLSMGKKSQEIAVKLFSPEKVGDEWHTLIRNINQ